MVFWEYDMWSSMIQIGILCLILLLSNILRRKVPFLRKSLLPTAVIGGFVTLILKSIGLLDNILITDFLDKITYHALCIGFIALGLKTAYGQGELQNKKVLKDGINSGLIIVGTYLIQAVIGLGITIVLAYTIFPDLFAASGILLPLGFGQGPGQANNFGTNFELQYGFIGGKSFGLSIASLGFIWACALGVIYMNYLIRKGKLTRNDNKKTGETNIGELVSQEDEIPLAEAIDKFTVQICLVMLVFMTSFGFMWGFDKLFIETGIFGNFGVNTLRPLIWGFNFIFGTLFALLYKKIFRGLKSVHLMNRVYTNNFMLNRIAGVVFDFMIIAAISAINIEVMSDLWVPFFIITTFGGVITFLYVKYLSKIFYKDYKIPGFLAMYGMLTGTASTGVALLREVDPDFKTPASNNLVTGSTAAIVFGFPLMLIIGLAPNMPGLAWIILLFFFLVINILLFRAQLKRKFQKKSQNQ
ncbi:MAG: sodium/glutamate symporter [Bacilli bacterium]|nr:sodium/glutamate symporter [Bacilli bacterium]